MRQGVLESAPEAATATPVPRGTPTKGPSCGQADVTVSLSRSVTPAVLTSTVTEAEAGRGRRDGGLFTVLT